MSAVLVFPDVAEAVCAQLTGWLDPSVAIGNLVPNPRPARFIVVRRVGGTRITAVTEAAQLSVQCYAGNQPDAEDLAQAARSVIFAMGGTRSLNGVDIYRVDDIGGPADAPDELSDQPRVLFSVALHVRGHVPPTP